ncbi:hypothetical protein G6F21_014378 [Rhizopus arrhizus]|nr:hypothetical protein G6F21_014378 [Rhizopus arrhizus]
MIAINAGAHGDGAALGDGVAVVEQQVHVDLVQFRRQALHQRQLAELAHQGDLVLELVPDDVDGRFQARVQVDQLPRLIATGIREVLQVAHDAGGHGYRRSPESTPSGPAHAGRARRPRSR